MFLKNLSRGIKETKELKRHDDNPRDFTILRREQKILTLDFFFCHTANEKKEQGPGFYGKPETLPRDGKSELTQHLYSRNGGIVVIYI